MIYVAKLNSTKLKNLTIKYNREENIKYVGAVLIHSKHVPKSYLTHQQYSVKETNRG